MDVGFKKTGDLYIGFFSLNQNNIAEYKQHVFNGRENKEPHRVEYALSDKYSTTVEKYYYSKDPLSIIVFANDQVFDVPVAKLGLNNKDSIFVLGNEIALKLDIGGNNKKAPDYENYLNSEEIKTAQNQAKARADEAEANEKREKAKIQATKISSGGGKSDAGSGSNNHPTDYDTVKQPKEDEYREKGNKKAESEEQEQSPQS